MPPDHGPRLAFSLVDKASGNAVVVTQMDQLPQKTKVRPTRVRARPVHGTRENVRASRTYNCTLVHFAAEGRALGTVRAASGHGRAREQHRGV